MLVCRREVNVIVSMNSLKVPLHISFFGIVMVDRQIRQTHFEYDIVKKMSSSHSRWKFLLSYLVHLPHSFLYPFFSRDKLELTRLLAHPCFAVARVVDRTCVVTWVSERMTSQTGCPVRQSSGTCHSGNV